MITLADTISSYNRFFLLGFFPKLHIFTLLDDIVHIDDELLSAIRRNYDELNPVTSQGGASVVQQLHVISQQPSLDDDSSLSKLGISTLQTTIK